MSRVAIVTGGGSGIGAAISRVLGRRGDTIVVADIDGAAAQRTADEVGGTAAKVDVRDGEAVQALVDETVREHGRLDLMFNNAGIGVGGDATELTTAHWDRIIDINLRGVTNGISAAYPFMAKQGSGHIINTASIAGLIASPYMAPYVATKHAVLGLSLALRGEAKAYGVKVLAVCPGWTDTPILDSTGPDDLPKPSLAQDGGVRETAEKMGKLYSPDALAQDILEAIAKDKAVLVVPGKFRVMWRLSRLSPTGFAALTGAIARREQRKLTPPDPLSSAAD
ncbi:MAG TPA: SDR family NAD(P)-dependent oxidoreductase [Mycobacteriales bacterium]|nr:SDR family NAD(P)-dependent oxidoreductase [Mycobacteriales bacterium]